MLPGPRRNKGPDLGTTHVQGFCSTSHQLRLLGPSGEPAWGAVYAALYARPLGRSRVLCHDDDGLRTAALRTITA